MISMEIDEESDPKWNDRLLDSQFGTIYQTKEIASYYEATLGWLNFFLKFTNQRGEIVGQLMLSAYSRFDKKGKVSKILKKIPVQKSMIYHWVYGPVIFNSIFNSEISKLLSEFLVSKNCIVSGHEHPLSSGILSLMGKPFQIRRWGTFLIDLSLGQNVLWNNLDKHAARKNIERSQRRGVHVREMTSSDISLYHEMLQETKRKANSDVDISAVKKLWNNLHNVGFTGLLAFENEIPIGGILVSFFNKYINEWGIARTERDTINKLYSHDRLKWAIIEWGVKNKFRYYDLSGVNPASKTEKEKGIFRYKEKWGGTYIEYQTCNI